MRDKGKEFVVISMFTGFQIHRYSYVELLIRIFIEEKLFILFYKKYKNITK